MNHLLKFRVEKLRRYLDLIASRVVRETVAATNIEILDPDEPRFDPPPDTAAWKPFHIGEQWGAKQQWTSFRAEVKVPVHWTGQAIELRSTHHVAYLESTADDNYPAGPEGQIFINGQRVGAIDQQHTKVRCSFEAGKTYDVRAVCFAGRCACRHILSSLALVWIDSATEKLYYDLRLALEVVHQLGEASVAREKLIEATDAAIHALDAREISLALRTAGETTEPTCDAFYSSVPSAQMAFDSHRARIQPAAEAPEVVAVGHAHIDLGWLWPIKQTRHKCVRTFATQCRLLDQYDDWVYNQSSPQAYAWVEKDAPDLFEQIRVWVAADRWEADGATWVECDTNVPSGESLVRQLLYGKRYFQEKFGVNSRMLWLPDVFGYSAALPQLLRLAGVDGFVTSKISWSQFNRFPHDTFRWRGIDGTDVPTHFITTPCQAWFFTYNAMMTVDEVKRNWEEYRQKDLLLPPLLTFGFGDGGGGPTEEMLEIGQRLAALPVDAAIPKVKYEKAGALLDHIVSQSSRLPVWDGELYLEYHRGTYTTQGWIKRANRKNEVHLHNVEWLASLAAKYGHSLDKAKLDSMWQDLLLMQFHDILPGSSVGELYDEVRPMHASIADQAESMIADAAAVVCEKMNTSGYRQPVALFNTLAWDRSGPVRLPDGAWRDDVTVPAGGWAVIDAAAPPTRDDTHELDISDDGRRIANRFWNVTLDDQGCIVELYDRANQRHVLAQGRKANEWQVFEDRPMGNDAWDIDLYYQEHPLPAPKCDSMQVMERGPVRVAVEVTSEIQGIGAGPHSTITQRIVLYANNPRIDFETRIDWHAHHQLLKVAFPVDIRATEATCQIQFGHVRRPTHRNTSWDLARFEVCAHRFVDLSEHGYGVALLNDCKYGHDIHNGVLRLTCIKSPQSPHTRADQGLHEFTYALLPHAGTFQDAGVIRAADELNVPALAIPVTPSEGDLPATFRFVECDNPAVIVDTLKPAEDGDALILRLYESHGSHARATLTFTETPQSVQLVNLLEQPVDNDCDPEHDGTRVSLRLRPFQIVSLRVRGFSL